MCTDLVLFLPVLKQLHESVALLHQLRVHALPFGEGQDGFQSALGLAGRPQTSAGGGETVVHQPVFILDHFFKDGRLTLHTVGEISSSVGDLSFHAILSERRVRKRRSTYV